MRKNAMLRKILSYRNPKKIVLMNFASQYNKNAQAELYRMRQNQN